MEFVPCPQCGSFNSTEAKVCAECRAPLPEEPPAPPPAPPVHSAAPAEAAAPEAVEEPPPPSAPAPFEAPPEVLAKVQQLENAIAEKPHAPALYLQLSQVYLTGKRNDLAAGTIERALEQDPKNVYLRHRLAQITGVPDVARVGIAQAPATTPAAPREAPAVAPAARGATAASRPVYRPAAPAARPAPRARSQKWKLTAGAVAAAVALGMVVKVWLFPSTRCLVTGEFRAHAPAWAPTGKHLAFLIDDDTATRIAVYDLSKGAFRTVGPATAWDSRGFSWSPDGTQLAYTAPGGDGEWQPAVFVVDAGGGQPRPIAAGSSPAWTRDGGGLIMVCTPETGPAYDDEDGESSTLPAQDWGSRYCRVDVHTGRAQDTPLRATYGEALSALHEAVVFEQSPEEPLEQAAAAPREGDFDQLVDAVAAGRARNVGEGSRDLSRELEARRYADKRAAAMRAERLPYAADVFVASLASGAPVAVTSDRQSAFPSWTADGDRILFASNGAAGLEFCTVNPDGSGRRTILSGVKRVDPYSVTLSRDAKSVFFVATVPADAGVARLMTGESPADLHVARVGSKTARRLANRHPFKQRYAVSPDGRRVVYEVLQDVKLIGGAGKSELWLMRR